MKKQQTNKYDFENFLKVRRRSKINKNELYGSKKSPKIE